MYGIDLDDFAGIIYNWHTKSPLRAAAIHSTLNQVILNTKSANPNLKLGVTIYEDQIQNPAGEYVDDSKLPQDVKRKVDYVQLYTHYRANGPNYESYVRRAKQMFRNAKIIAGSYPYDRIDYLPCSQSSKAKCSTQEEISLYRRSIEIQAELLKKGAIEAIEFYTPPFGSETQWTHWNEPGFCEAARKAQCIDNTIPNARVCPGRIEFDTRVERSAATEGFASPR